MTSFLKASLATAFLLLLTAAQAQAQFNPTMHLWATQHRDAAVLYEDQMAELLDGRIVPPLADPRLSGDICLEMALTLALFTEQSNPNWDSTEAAAYAAMLSACETLIEEAFNIWDLRSEYQHAWLTEIQAGDADRTAFQYFDAVAHYDAAVDEIHMIQVGVDALDQCNLFFLEMLDMLEAP